MSATTPRTPLHGPPRQAPSIETRLSISALPFPAAVPAGPPAIPQLLPNVLIPGAGHAGAAMLASDLGRHPDVCLPEVKYIGHFTPLCFGRPVEAPLDDYDRHFGRWSGERYRVEAAPDYFDGGRALTCRIAETMPGIRIVLVLRDPADRLWTSYVDKLTRGRLPRAMSFETFVDRCLALRANRAERFEGNRHYRSLSSGFFVEFLPDWLDTFGAAARVVFTENLQDERAAQVGALFDWLGLNAAAANPPAGEDDDSDGYPSSERAPSFNRRLWPVFQRTPGPWREPPSGVTGTLRRLPRQSERTRARVRSLYCGANRELAALLRDRGYQALPDWLAGA